jgi:Lantibiotic dehydratase, N terminus
MDEAPFLLRVAGLPMETVERLATGLCTEICAETEIRAELDPRRAALVDLLYREVHDAPADRRRFLLEVKRDCFNGRSLRRHLADPQWGDLIAIAGALPGEILALEERLAEWEERFTVRHAAEQERCRRDLFRLLADRPLLRGIALASPLLADSLGRLREGAAPDLAGRRGRKLEASFLRYASRAAVKLSPYSTLTRLALGAVAEGAAPGAAPELRSGPWTEVSLLRLKRYLLDQVSWMLRRHPPLREALPVLLNDTVEEIAPGRYLFLRPSFWEVDPDRGKLVYHRESLVKAGLGTPFMERLRRALAGGPLPCRDLAAALAGPGGAVEPARESVDKLLHLGLLHLALPWSSQAPHLERTLLDWLRSLSADPALAPLTGHLARLVALEEGYAEAAEPARSIAAMESLIEEIWQAGAGLARLGPEVKRAHLTDCNLYEDVFVAPLGAGTAPLLRAPRAAVDAALASLAPVVRLAHLFSRHLEFLATVEAFAEQTWPGRAAVGVLELFSAVQPLWLDFMKLHVATRNSDRWTTSWNPLNLAAVEALDRLRGEILAELPGCLSPQEGETRVSLPALSALAARVPDRWAPLTGACLFVQPADAAWSRWVLNRLKDGTGRFGSRYTAVMDGELRDRYTARLTARSVFAAGGEEVELVDVVSIQGDTLNVHSPQTRRVLEAVGERTGLPASRRIALADLRAAFGGGRSPRLVDGMGRHCLPVHLGGAAHDYMPSPVKFLCLFGIPELRAVFPEAAMKAEGDIKVQDRLVLGNVVLSRRRWLFPPERLAATAGLSEAAAFLALNRWRLDRGIPDRVFLNERVHSDLVDELYKPQLIDFTSPLFLAVFRSALKAGPRTVALEEMLPTPEMFPCDATGSRWAVELMLDTLALLPGGGALTMTDPSAGFPESLRPSAGGPPLPGVMQQPARIPWSGIFVADECRRRENP